MLHRCIDYIDRIKEDDPNAIAFIIDQSIIIIIIISSSTSSANTSKIKRSACEIDSALCEIEDIGDTNNKNNRAIRYSMRFQKCSSFASQDMVKPTLEAVFPDISQLVMEMVMIVAEEPDA